MPVADDLPGGIVQVNELRLVMGTYAPSRILLGQEASLLDDGQRVVQDAEAGVDPNPAEPEPRSVV
jgi:hypothetical protein